MKSRRRKTVFHYALKYCNPITEEGSILALQNLLHISYDLNIVFKMATPQVGIESGKQEKK